MASDDIPSGSRTPRQALDDLRDALKCIGALGVRMNPSGRLTKSLAVLETVAAGGRVDPHERSQAHLDASQLTEIGRHLVRKPARGLVGKLQLLASDPLVEPPSIGGTPGRDAQFELYLASEFVAGGLAVSFDEPDLIVHDGLIVVGIAAKRVKSTQQFEKRLNEARRQLLRQRHVVTHGLVAMDVSKAVNPDGAVVVSDALPDGPPAAGLLTELAAEPVKRSVESWLHDDRDRRLTCGVLLFAAALQYVPTIGGVVFSANYRCLGLGQEFAHVRARLQDAAERGMRRPSADE